MTHGFSGPGAFDADREPAPRAQLPRGEGLRAGQFSGDGPPGDGPFSTGPSGDGLWGDVLKGDGPKGDGLRGGGFPGDGPRGDGFPGEGLKGDGLKGDGSRGGGAPARPPVPAHAAGPDRALRAARRRRAGRWLGVTLLCLVLITVATVRWRAPGLVAGAFASMAVMAVYLLIEEFQRKDVPPAADRAPGRPAEMWPAHVDPYPQRPVHGPGPHPSHPQHQPSAAYGGPHHPAHRAPAPVPAQVAPPPPPPPSPSTSPPPSAQPSQAAPPSVPERPAQGPAWPLPGVRLPAPLPPSPPPPKLHRTSKTSALPWRLPAAPAPPAMTADAATVGDLEVRAASLVGPGHRSDPTHAGPRQDAYRLGRDGRSAHLIVAVADGMSDSAHADVAAAVAVSALVNTLRQRLDEGAGPRTLDAGQVFLEAAQQVYAAAEQRGWSDEDVRTVALAAVLPTRPDADGGRTLWLARVGDPSGWFRGTDRWKPLFGGKEGGFDRGKLRHFLPHTPQQAESRRIDVGRGGALALTTDGVGDALAQLPVAARWFHRQWARPVTAHDLLLHIGYEAQQRNDDRTAVLVWWRPAGGPR
ncbi:protein phosphatase 2C domain-containing protein [Streptomyces sp. NPDC017979]|uniref:protein phosphatase 2C domain-containing protein n=1 Tax=Streptomyces sp. NPDC017979 TaxID=3365024 RepID=UPI0037A6E193